MKTLEFKISEKFEDNIDKYGYDENTCECCGKQLKDKTNAVHVVEPSMVIPSNITEDELIKLGITTQGVYYLGSSCIKKYPKEYRIKI